MNILEELWNGSLCQISQNEYRTDEYQDLAVLFERNENNLLHTLNDSQKEDLQKLQDVIEEMRSIAECSAFITGFRLAVRLMAASLGG